MKLLAKIVNSFQLLFFFFEKVPSYVFDGVLNTALYCDYRFKYTRKFITFNDYRIDTDYIQNSWLSLPSSKFMEYFQILSRSFTEPSLHVGHIMWPEDRNKKHFSTVYVLIRSFKNRTNCQTIKLKVTNNVFDNVKRSDLCLESTRVNSILAMVGEIRDDFRSPIDSTHIFSSFSHWFSILDKDIASQRSSQDPPKDLKWRALSSCFN